MAPVLVYNISAEENFVGIKQIVEDKIISPSGTKEFSARTGSSDKTLKIWEGMFHEMHNEIGKADVLALMVDWLTQRS